MPIPEKLTPECKHFLQLCFIKDPADRPEAATLLSHPWVEKYRTVQEAPPVASVEEEKRNERRETGSQNSETCDVGEDELDSSSKNVPVEKQKQLINAINRKTTRSKLGQDSKHGSLDFHSS